MLGRNRAGDRPANQTRSETPHASAAPALSESGRQYSTPTARRSVCKSWERQSILSCSPRLSASRCRAQASVAWLVCFLRMRERSAEARLRSLRASFAAR